MGRVRTKPLYRLALITCLMAAGPLFGADSRGSLAEFSLIAAYYTDKESPSIRATVLANGKWAGQWPNLSVFVRFRVDNGDWVQVAATPVPGSSLQNIGRFFVATLPLDGRPSQVLVHAVASIYRDDGTRDLVFDGASKGLASGPQKGSCQLEADSQLTWKISNEECTIIFRGRP